METSSLNGPQKAFRHPGGARGCHGALNVMEGSPQGALSLGQTSGQPAIPSQGCWMPAGEIYTMPCPLDNHREGFFGRDPKGPLIPTPSHYVRLSKTPSSPATSTSRDGNKPFPNALEGKKEVTGPQTCPGWAERGTVGTRVTGGHPAPCIAEQPQRARSSTCNGSAPRAEPKFPPSAGAVTRGCPRGGLGGTGWAPAASGGAGGAKHPPPVRRAPACGLHPACQLNNLLSRRCNHYP